MTKAFIYNADKGLVHLIDDGYDWGIVSLCQLICFLAAKKD